MSVRVQSAPFDMGAEVAAFTASAPGAGAVVTFSGLVRDEGGSLSAMEIEHYPGMTERALEKIRAEAVGRWSLTDAMVIHRYGPLKPGEQIMMVATAARHRKDAFDAAEFLMDYLKSRAPFWKKEFGADGETWVAAKDDDEAALERW
ncbi:MAG: molybdenum cofactor biosynthesis protein MoaE [Paracoccaceae bacterium]|nr:molybdenum cofactor biosynthesis protein MoaE [Paracoccaceae bacterium]